jgi:hypothetical protein
MERYHAPENEMETVNVDAPVPRKSGYKGMSPLQAALSYGGAASTVMGPLGLIVGGIAGITAKKMRDNYLDKEAAYNAQMRSEQSNFNSEVASEQQIADPEEARLLNHAKRVADAGWTRLANGDASGREMIDNANSFIAEIINGDRQARKQEMSQQQSFQRELVGGAANDYRKQYQTHVTDFETVDAQVARVLDLTAQADFDPNKPFNKAMIAELLSTGIGGFYRDAPDAMDAIAQGAGGLNGLGKYGSTISGIIDGVTTFVKADDFKITREDYNRIAFNMRKVAKDITGARMERLNGQAQQLDGFARKTGAIPDDYSLSEYISGGTKELKILPVPQFQPSTVKPPPTQGLLEKGKLDKMLHLDGVGRAIRDKITGRIKPSTARPVN